MQSFQLNVKQQRGPTWLGHQMGLLNTNRMNTPIGFFIMAVMACMLGYGMVSMGYKIGIVIVVCLLGLPFFWSAVVNQKAGLYMIFILSFFVLGIKRFIGEAPVGLAMDIMIAGTFVGLLAKQIHNRASWKFMHNPVAYMVGIWIGLIFLQLFNPIAISRIAWLYTVRATGGFMVMYYVTLYAVDNVKYLTNLLKIWIVLAILVMLYGFKQEYIGFFQFETNWIMEDSERYGLLYIMGRFRKFSFLSDPMIYGVFMALTSVVCLILASGPYQQKYKIGFILLAILMANAMIHSGTRAAYIAFPVGIAFFSTITLQRTNIILAASVLVIGFVLAKMPTGGNLNLIRFQTAFRPEEDESYKVREANKAFIKPFIQTLPFGAGLGTTGYWGKRFSQGSPLADFPPDSGFVRVAVEQGYVSLFIFLVLFFVAFNQGVKNHYKIRSPRLQNYSMALLAGLLILTVANFPQEAIGQIPNNLIFFVMLAMSTKLYELDQLEGQVALISVSKPINPYQSGSIGKSRSLVGMSKPLGISETPSES
jgi:hypothetical protein